MQALEEKNVMIVNSDQHLLKNLSAALTRTGYSVLASESALQAAELLQQQPIHLLICNKPKKSASKKEVIRFELLVNIAKANLRDFNTSLEMNLNELIQRTVGNTAESKEEGEGHSLLIVKLGKDRLPQLDTFATARFNSHMQQLKEMRHFIAHHCLKVPGDPVLLTTLLQLASNEAFCNIVKHGYQEQQQGKVLLHLSIGLDGVQIEIVDQGRSFDPKAVPLPDPAGGQLQGFGWFIIVKIADQLSYIPKQGMDEWNRLRIFKNFCFEG